MGLLIMVTVVNVQWSRIGKASGDAQKTHAQHKGCKRLCGSGLAHCGLALANGFFNLSIRLPPLFQGVYGRILIDATSQSIFIGIP